MPKIEWKALLCKLLGHWPEISNLQSTPYDFDWFCRWCGQETFDADFYAARKCLLYRRWSKRELLKYTKRYKSNGA